MKRLIGVVLLAIVVSHLSGCATFRKAKRADELEQELAELKAQKDEELSELERAKMNLEDRLQKELSEYKARLEMTERGLVLTFLAEILFDSGKAAIKEQAKDTLKDIGNILTQDVPDYFIGIEGHTDNEPIRYSGWKSNWHLGSARALAVLEYFIDEGGVAAEKLSATTYGEYRPVEDNSTAKGKQSNRRVEIIILNPLVSRSKAAQ